MANPGMKRTVLTTAVLLISLFTISTFVAVPSARAGQAPGSSASPDMPVSHHDRVYTADQFSNTVTVTDPVAISSSASSASEGLLYPAI
jgi:hypothetical protein